MIERYLLRFVFQGLGAYAFVIPFFALLGTQLIATVLFGTAAMQHNVGTVNGIALVVSALLLGWFDRWARGHPRVVLNEKTLDETVVRNSMFFVPLRYWSYLYGLVGLAMYAISAGG